MEYSYQKPNKNMTICSEKKNKQQYKKCIDFRYKKIGILNYFHTKIVWKTNFQLFFRLYPKNS